MNATWYRVEKRGYRTGRIESARVVKETAKRIVTLGLWYEGREDRHDKDTWDYSWFDNKSEAERFAYLILDKKLESLESDIESVRKKMEVLP